MTTDTIGGVWTYSMELIESLAAHEIEVCLVTMGRNLSSDQWDDLSYLPNVVLQQSTYRLEWMEDPWDDIEASGRWLLEIERSYRPDLIHLNGYSHAALPFKAPKLVVAHSCVASWWQEVKSERLPIEWQKYITSIRRGLSSADHVVAPTRAMLAMLREIYDIPFSGEVIENGRSARLFLAGNKEPFIMTAGRLWDEAKNLEALDIVSSSLSWPIYVAGEQENPEGQKTSAANVTLLGKLGQRDIASWLSRASIYALPAKYEPFGLSVLEAALSGCALVLGDITSLRELWGDSAVYVSPNDHAELSNALNDLAADSRMRSDLASRSLARARTYGAARFGARYSELYTRLLRS